MKITIQAYLDKFLKDCKEAIRVRTKVVNVSVSLMKVICPCLLPV